MARLGSFLSVKNLLIFLFFAAPTIHYRVEMGGFSFALMEPVVLFVSVALLAHQIVSWRRLVILKEPLAFLFAAITLLAFVIRPWDSNWQHGLSDVRDWFIPLLGFVVFLTTIRRGWRHWVTIFLALVWFNALVGIYQHFTDSFRPFISELAAYKTGFTVLQEENRLILVPFAVGFFSHPNGFAMYLFVGLMMALGKFYKSKKKQKAILFAVVLLPIALSLYWTFAKASLLVMVGAISLFWLERRVKSNPILLAIMGAGLMTSAVVLWQVAQYAPPALLATFWWRVGLWQTVLVTIGTHPVILLLGNGLESFAGVAYYGQPHNLYLYLLLEYGLIGLMWGIALVWYLWRRGIYIRRVGWTTSEPMLAAIWIGLLGYFVIGLVESNLMGIENRMIFMTVAACFTGLVREMTAEKRPN